jgi:threonine dehydratase
MNKLLRLTPEERARGVIAASSGNHGAAVAYGASKLGVGARLFVPEHASPMKIDAIRSYGAETVLFGRDCVDAEAAARREAEEQGKPYISPYNDRDVAIGQGTIGVELERQLDTPLDAVFIALGGGGLIAGVGSYLEQRMPDCRIIACSPAESPAMHACLRAGEIIDVPCHPTLSDGTAGGVEAGAITFELCRDIIDDSVLVSEDEIRHHMRHYLLHEHQLIEGAAAVALAGYDRLAADYRGQRIGIIICGANVSVETLRTVLA